MTIKHFSSCLFVSDESLYSYLLTAAAVGGMSVTVIHPRPNTLVATSGIALETAPVVLSKYAEDIAENKADAS